MIIANTNKHIAPYWNDGLNLKLGLNQLGIRNVAEQMFAKLLPGLNNVSSRIRYYSFYCWIINNFYEGKDSIVEEDFNPYLRRAELLLALINATREDSSGIPGITYALTQIQSGIDVISLKDGATWGKESYWANVGGIFRQYYSASLEEIGLVGVNNQSSILYNIRKDGEYINGKMLAESFSESVGQDGKIFLSKIHNDDVNIEELRSLNESFNMKLMSHDMVERKLLERMILQKDNPSRDNQSFHRRNSINYVLKYLSLPNTTLNPIGFSRYMYDEFLRGKRDLTSWGWYAYYLDDNWQYQLTRIFNQVLITLKGNKDYWTPIDVISENICHELLSDFEIDKSTTLEKVVAMADQCGKNNVIHDAINNLLWLYKENKDVISESEQHYHEMGIEVENYCDFMKAVTKRLKAPFVDYVRHIVVEDVIFRHYRVSFRKMLQTGLATQKFTIENGNIRFIEDWPTSHTSPRIDTLRDFLIDLCLIEREGNVTKYGIELLNGLSNENI